MVKWLRPWTRNPMGSPQAGSNPAHSTSQCLPPVQVTDEWAFLVAQTAKSPPAKHETRVQPLGQEDPLEEDMATYFSILAWRIPMDREAWQAIVHGLQRVRYNRATKHSIAPE